MARRTGLLLLALGVVGMAAPPAVAAKDEKKAEPVVVKYIRAKKGIVWGKNVMIIVVSPLKGRSKAELAVPNRTHGSSQFDPPPHVMKLVKQLKRGDLIRVKFENFQGHNMLRSIDRAERGKEGPDLPVFIKLTDKKVDGQRHLAVVIRKGDKTDTLLIPNRKNKAGKLVPDRKVAEQARKLRKGDLIEVEFEDAIDKLIGGIYRYYPPAKGRFVKLEEKVVGTRKHLCAVVKRGGKTINVLVPNGKDEKGKPVPDEELAAAVKALKPRETVEFKFYKDGRNIYLRHIKVIQEDKPPKKRRRTKDR